MRLETLLPLGKVDPGLRAPNATERSLMMPVAGALEPRAASGEAGTRLASELAASRIAARDRGLFDAIARANEGVESGGHATYSRLETTAIP